MHFQSKTTHNAQTVNVTLMAQEYEMHVVKLQLDLEVKIEELEKQVWSVFYFFQKDSIKNLSCPSEIRKQRKNYTAIGGACPP